MEINKKRKRFELDLDKKRELILYHRDNRNLSQKQIKDHFDAKWNCDISKSTVSDLINNKSRNYLELGNIRSPGAKRLRDGVQHNLEKCLYVWFNDVVNNGISISEDFLMAQAKVFGEQLAVSDLEFKYSKGWLANFKKRFNIRSYIKSGESASVDMKAVEEGKSCKNHCLNKSINKIMF